MPETKPASDPSEKGRESTMKPLHVGILVIVAAVGGGLFTKWQTSRNVAPIAVRPMSPAPPAASEKPVAMQPATPTQPAAEQPLAAQIVVRPAETTAPARRLQQARPSALSEEMPHRRKSRPVQPRMVAQSVTPHPPEVNVAPQAPAQVEPPAHAEPPRAEPLQPEPAPAEAAPAVNAPPASPAPAAAPEPPVQVTLRAGILLSARTVEGLSSERNQVGDTFTATLEQPLSVDGWVIAERGARLEGKIVQSQRAGRVRRPSDLAIELTQLVTSDGQRVAIETETFEKHGVSSTGQDAAKIGAGAAIGAAIGAVAGGGKGAGIGAAAGGAVGAGDVMLTRGKPAVLPAETHINFRLRNSVTITERTGRTD
jgi:hypothetical protein